MIRTEKKIDVVSPKGEVLVSFRITESEVPPSNNGNGSSRNNNSKPSKPNSQHTGDTMTDAQKKFLFRICADQGIEGEEAHTKLKELFGVESLKDVSKFDASKMIESMLAETKGGNGNGSSF
jgi:hypothetical protein